MILNRKSNTLSVLIAFQFSQFSVLSLIVCFWAAQTLLEIFKISPLDISLDRLKDDVESFLEFSILFP